MLPTRHSLQVRWPTCAEASVAQPGFPLLSGLGEGREILLWFFCFWIIRLILSQPRLFNLYDGANQTLF
jgi:hypothetical protein